jgi:signal transduction histidine kinase
LVTKRKPDDEPTGVTRIRWYHFYFLLALFDVLVITLSLHLHSRTLRSVSALIGETTKLDEQSRWLQLAQQRVLELNAPGNDLFRSEDYDLQRHRFDLARQNMRMALETGEKLMPNAELPRDDIDAMVKAAEGVFGEFALHHQERIEPGSGRSDLSEAGESMARMDDAQHRALRTLARAFSKNAADRDQLLQQHERDLQQRAEQERYFIGAIMVILVGILGFGRRLQQADRALQEERRRLVEERRERLAAIGELCSSVAHGIRNPLAAIRSSAQLALELGKLDAESRQRMEDILSEGGRLGDRVNGLLGIARATAHHFDTLDLADVARSAAAGLDLEFKNRGLRLDLRCTHAPLQIKGDRHQIEQIVVELLSNAMDCSPAGGTVTLSCRTDPTDAARELIVEDEGPGVPEEVRDRVFDVFFTTKSGGTGIGLATIMRYAKLHGGDVLLEHGAGGGARFRVRFPRIEDHAGSNGDTVLSRGRRRATKSASRR